MRNPQNLLAIFPVLIASLFFTSAPAGAGAVVLSPVNAEAVVPSALSLNITILDAAGSQASSLDFGRLSQSTNTFGSNRLFRIVLSVNSQGASYEIRQDASPFTRNGGSETIPSAAFLVKPAYLESENSGLSIPAGAQLASEGPASVARTIFKDPSGSSRTISLVYSMKNGVPSHQPSGSYSGTLQFTLVTT